MKSEIRGLRGTLEYFFTILVNKSPIMFIGFWRKMQTVLYKTNVFVEKHGFCLRVVMIWAANCRQSFFKTNVFLWNSMVLLESSSSFFLANCIHSQTKSMFHSGSPKLNKFLPKPIDFLSQIRHIRKIINKHEQG